MLSGCGHWTQQERPSEVNAALIAFLRARGVQGNFGQRNIVCRGRRFLFSSLASARLAAVEPINLYIGSDALERQRRALADADAHRRKRVAAAAPLKLERSGACDARARHAERMAERDRPAVRIDMVGIVPQA